MDSLEFLLWVFQTMFCDLAFGKNHKDTKNTKIKFLHKFAHDRDMGKFNALHKNFDHVKRLGSFLPKILSVLCAFVVKFIYIIILKIEFDYYYFLVSVILVIKTLK